MYHLVVDLTIEKNGAMNSLHIVALCLMIISALQPIMSQEVLLDKTVEDTISRPEIGPNAKKFSHFYYSLANFVPNNKTGLSIEPFGSVMQELGRRHKRQFGKTYSMGYSFSYSWSEFVFEQKEGKVFPSEEMHRLEKIRLNAVNLEVFQRINVGKRGNYMGYFMDIGASASWNFLNRYIIKDETESGDFGRRSKTSYLQPSFINPFIVSLNLRFGINNVLLWASYSLKERIDSEYFNTNIEGLYIGLQFGFHK